MLAMVKACLLFASWGVAAQDIFLARESNLGKAPAWPRFSWNTVPVFYHSCNFTGAYTEEALDTVAKFPMVTIEKGQGVHDPSDTRYAEDKILETLRSVKQRDNNISTIFYYNSVLDWPFYALHAKLLKHPDFQLKKKDGSTCTMNGDGSFPNHTNMLVFDFAQKDVRDFWASECINMTKTGFVDGCFSDRSNAGACDAGQDYTDGHLLVHQELQKKLGDGVLIANNDPSMPGVNAVMLEGFKATEGSMLEVKQAAARGKIVQAHAGYGTDGDDNHCKNITNSLAAFLIAAGQRSYYGCSRGWKVQADPIEQAWRPEYDRPLGNPQGDAVKTGNVYCREFKSSKGTTVVRFDAKSNVGEIHWADDEDKVTPCPAPAPPPPHDCSTAGQLNSTGIANHDIGPTPWSKHTTETPAACCQACSKWSGCTAWTWYSDGYKECHFHDDVSGMHDASGRVSGVLKELLSE